MNTNSCSRCDADRISLIPSTPAEPGRIAQAGKNLVHDAHARKETFSIYIHGARQSQQRAQAVARVSSAVVEIEIPNHRRVDKGCGLRRQPVPKTENVARILARDLTGCQSPTDLRRLTVISPERAAERVDQPLGSGMHALIGQAIEVRGRRIFS